MPRKPQNKRLEVNLSTEQYQALLRAAEAEGYISIDPHLNLETSGSVAAYVRDLFEWHVEGFAAAKPILRRGKYKRQHDGDESEN